MKLNHTILILTLGALAIANAQPAPPPLSKQALIADLVTANRILANEDIVDAYGHVSVRDPNNPNYFYLSRSMPPGNVTAADIVQYDLDGNPVAAAGVASYSERFIHSEIYRARPDVMAVVHDHAHDILPFSITGVPMQPVYHMAAFVGYGIPVFDPRDAGSSGNLLIGSPNMGKALVAALGDKPGILVRGHGAVLTGPNLHITVARAYYLNVNARLQQQALQLGGGKAHFLDADDVKISTPIENFERAWVWWKQRLSAK